MATSEIIENNILQTDFYNSTGHRKDNTGKCFGTSLVALHPVLLWRALKGARRATWLAKISKNYYLESTCTTRSWWLGELWEEIVCLDVEKASRDKRNTSSVVESKEGRVTVGRGEEGEWGSLLQSWPRADIIHSKAENEDWILMHVIRGNFRSPFFFFFFSFYFTSIEMFSMMQTLLSSLLLTFVFCLFQYLVYTGWHVSNEGCLKVEKRVVYLSKMTFYLSQGHFSGNFLQVP